MNKIQLKVKLLNTNAKMPSYGSSYAAGMDICSCEELIVPALTTRLVKSGLSISWSGLDASNYYLRIAPRSGLAYKSGIFVNAGVIDYDYRGEIGVLLYNSHNEHFKVNQGDRIAQMILEKNYRPEIICSEELDETDRGSGGFGSTGNN
jgi:dUTP pyrophosphatase